MKLRNIAKSSLFAKSFNLAKSNPNKTGFMFLFDLMFVISFFSLQKLLGYFAQSLVLPSANLSIFILVAFSALYYLIILFVYSFFKYCVLDFIKSLSNKTQFSFDRLGKFYGLNVIIGGVFFAILLLLNYILANIKQEYAPYAFIFLAVPYLLFLYVIANTSHSLFYRENTIKNTIKNSFMITFTKMKSYRETIEVLMLYAIVLAILIALTNYLFNFIQLKNYSLFLSVYSFFTGYLKQIFLVIFDLIFYLIIFTNRISFFNAVIESKK